MAVEETAKPSDGSPVVAGAGNGAGTTDAVARVAAAPATSSGTGDRWLIVAQLAAGVALVVFGALVAALSRAATHDIGTAVIGVGAALLPAGAAAGASARIAHSAGKDGGGSRAG